MPMMRRWWWTPACCLLLSVSSTAFAQTNLQLWGNVTLDWVKSDRLTYEFDIEPKVLVNFGLREQVPKRGVVVRDLVRVESRNSWYIGEGSGTSSVRFPNRVEFLVPLNEVNVSEDRGRYLLADSEWYVPLDEPAERFASKQRIRTGLGYRRNFTWRFEALYIWTRSRDTTDEGFSTDDNSIDIRMKRLF
jgi:hypothetical protein